MDNIQEAENEVDLFLSPGNIMGEDGGRVSTGGSNMSRRPSKLDVKEGMGHLIESMRARSRSGQRDVATPTTPTAAMDAEHLLTAQVATQQTNQSGTATARGPGFLKS